MEVLYLLARVIMYEATYRHEHTGMIYYLLLHTRCPGSLSRGQCRRHAWSSTDRREGMPLNLRIRAAELRSCRGIESKPKGTTDKVTWPFASFDATATLPRPYLINQPNTALQTSTRFIASLSRLILIFVILTMLSYLYYLFGDS